MENLWEPAKDFLFLSLFLVIAIVLKNKLKFLQRYLIPTSIIGGFIGLILGSEVLGWIELDADTLGTLIYHLMAIGFISLALKDREKIQGSKMDNVNTGMAIITAYLIQGILGFGITLALAYTLLPNLFPPFGLLLPLGFAQGPGQSYAIGRSWEELGFVNGGNIGLSVATIGFLWAIIFGIPLLNFLVRYKRRLNLSGKESRIGSLFRKREDIEEKHTENVPKKLFIDSLTIQIVLIGLVYLLTYPDSERGVVGTGTSGQLWPNSFRIAMGISFCYSYYDSYNSQDFLKFSQAKELASYQLS
ncbi:MAG: sodium/glutamate symporter [Actinomycetota bacterium]|nr:sodium/glutamate symporter [Actinomycetota bacterium]